MRESMLGLCVYIGVARFMFYHLRMALSTYAGKPVGAVCDKGGKVYVLLSLHGT